MKKIPLTQGKFALVDNEDFEWLSQWKWCVLKNVSNFYAKRALSRKDTNSRTTITILMHRIIIDATQEQEVDHRDGNGLNNCRSNLRFASRSQNNMNSHKIRGVSKYKGVCFDKSRKNKKWKTQIGKNNKQYSLGYFDNEIEAAKTYDTKAKELFGKFARSNFSG